MLYYLFSQSPIIIALFNSKQNNKGASEEWLYLKLPLKRLKVLILYYLLTYLLTQSPIITF